MLQKLLLSLAILDAVALVATKNFTCGDSPAAVADQLLCLPASYDLTARPKRYGLTRIAVTMDVDEFVVPENAGANEDPMSMLAFSGYLNLEWRDEGIVRRRGYGRDAVAPGVDYRNNPQVRVKQDTELVKYLWTPDLFIYGLKSYKVAEVLNKLDALWISTDGTVLYSMAVEIAVRCPVDLSYFPFDRHRCLLRVGSYAISDTKMIFVTERAGYVLKEANTVPLPFVIDKVDKLKESDATLDAGTLGNFSIAGMEVTMRRSPSSYLATVYAPSIVLIICTWISFLIPARRVAARATLLVVLLLGQVVITTAVTIALTNRPLYFTALDVWLLVCLLFHLGPLLELSVLLLRRQLSAKQTLTVRDVKYEAPPAGSNNGGTVSDNDDEEMAIDQDFWKVDKLYMGIFPFLFFMFNLIYWFVYTV